MKKLTSIAVLLISLTTLATAEQGSCLIVKHKGTVGRRMVWFALIGVPIAPGAKYDYVDSVRYPVSKMSFGGKELQEIQASGVHVIAMDKFTADGLAAAKKSCETEAPASTTTASAKVVPSPAIAQAPPSSEHTIEGYTISGPNSYDADSGQSLADASRRAKQQKLESR